MVETNEAILDRYLRPELKALYVQLKEGQQRKFKRIFGDIETMSTEKIASAIALVERTIKKNQEI